MLKARVLILSFFYLVHSRQHFRRVRMTKVSKIYDMLMRSRTPTTNFEDYLQPSENVGKEVSSFLPLNRVETCWSFKLTHGKTNIWVKGTCRNERTEMSKVFRMYVSLNISLKSFHIGTIHDKGYGKKVIYHTS